MTYSLETSVVIEERQDRHCGTEKAKLKLQPTLPEKGRA